MAVSLTPEMVAKKIKALINRLGKLLKFNSTWIPKSEVMVSKCVMFFGRNH